MSKNVEWLKDEMVLSLGFYLFDPNCTSKKNQTEFKDKLNSIFQNNRTIGSIGRRIANYQALDPDYIKNGRVGLNNGGPKVKEVFDEFVTNDIERVKITKVYSDFLNGNYDSNYNLDSLDDYKQDFVKNNVSNKNLKTSVVATIVFNRSNSVKQATLKRANGYCEFCGSKAPFLDKNDEPYLEVHHVIPLSENGPDELTNTLALCPNCHRRLHYGKEINKKEKEIIDKVLNK